MILLLADVFQWQNLSVAYWGKTFLANTLYRF